MAKKQEITPALEKAIENVLHEKLSHFLDDISFRIGQEYELAARRGGNSKGTVYAEDLHVKDRVYLTGYTMTNNSPTAGSVAWADLHVVVDGVDYTITNGNTALKYIYFTKGTTPTTLKFSATKPVLAEGDVLLFINEAGLHRNMLSDTNSTLPRAIGSNAVDSDAIMPKAVTAAELGDQAVDNTKIKLGAINNANLISGKIIGSGAIVDNAVNTLQLAGGAVDGTILKAGAINNADKFATTGQIIPGARLINDSVNTTQLAPNAVDNTILKAGAINSVDKFSGKVITNAAITDGTINTNTLAPGAVSATKLSIMRHVMY